MRSSYFGDPRSFRNINRDTTILPYAHCVISSPPQELTELRQREVFPIWALTTKPPSLNPVDFREGGKITRRASVKFTESTATHYSVFAFDADLNPLSSSLMFSPVRTFQGYFEAQRSYGKRFFERPFTLQ